MVAWIRFPTQALQALWALVELARTMVERIASHTDLTQRIDELERSRALWETQMEALVTRANEHFMAGRRTEERTRNMLRREREADDDEEVDSGPAIPPGWDSAGSSHANSGGGGTVPAVHPRLAPRAAATDRKWGRG